MIFIFLFLFQVDLPTPNYWLGGPRNNKSIWNGLMPKASCIMLCNASEEAVLCSHYAQLCNGILPLTQGLGQAT